MLTNQMDSDIDLTDEKIKAAALLPEDLREHVIHDNGIVEISYPVLHYPEKVKSLSFDKDSIVEGILSGIKGQYLLYNDGNVFNIRKHNGYMVELSY